MKVKNYLFVLAIIAQSFVFIATAYTGGSVTGWGLDDIKPIREEIAALSEYQKNYRLDDPEKELFLRGLENLFAELEETIERVLDEDNKNRLKAQFYKQLRGFQGFRVEDKLATLDWGIIPRPHIYIERESTELISIASQFLPEESKEDEIAALEN